MKKITFILLLSMTINSVMNAMEQEVSPPWHSLPTELKGHILSFVGGSEKVSTLIKNLKKVSATNKELYRLTQFIIDEFPKEYINNNSQKAYSEFFDSAQWDRTSLILIFLKAGIGVNSQDEDGNTALIHAAMFGCKKLVKMLLEYGASVNVQNRNNETPLMWAIRSKQLSDRKKIVKMLLRKGAHVNSRDLWGRTALILAEDSHGIRNKKIIDILKQAALNVQN